VPLLQPDAAGSIGRAARRTHLHLVGTARQPTSTPEVTRPTERGLVDAWREAHWTLRVKLQEVSRHLAGAGLEAAYDDARRCDNLLHDFARANADDLQRQVRDLRGSRTAGAVRPSMATRSTLTPANGDSSARLTVTERALLARMRELGPDDRLALLRLAVRLATSAQGRPRLE
jgi:hypothetical protein